MCARYTASLLLALAGVALSASIKGGINGTKGGGWIPPKDWDWSVTPGRLIPVSEATDDLPTPGYRMSQLQQMIPVLQNHQTIHLAVANESAPSNPDEKVILIGQNKPPTVNSEISSPHNDLSTTERQETTEHLEQSTPNEHKPESMLDEQELLLLHGQPIVYQQESVSSNKPSTKDKSEQIPVTEEPMVKVELPEICSITGIGCGDQRPMPQQQEVYEHPQVEEHTEVVNHQEVLPNTEAVPQPEIVHITETPTLKPEEQATEALSTISHAGKDEHTTRPDQLPLDSHHMDEQAVHHATPVDTLSEHSKETQRSNKQEPYKSNTTLFMSNNASDISQELVTLVVPHFNLSVPTVLHSVVSSVSEYIGTNDTSKHEVETPTAPKNSTDSLAADSQQVVQEIQFQPQQEQEQQVQLNISGPLQPEEKEHKIDEQKLLQIADSWSSSTESDNKTEKRMDIKDTKEEPKEAVVEEAVEKEGEAKVEAIKADHEVHVDPEVTRVTEQSTNSTESPSIGDRIESYWKAATGYVSKALHL